MRIAASFVCTPSSLPSRATFFTGLVPRQHGVQDSGTADDGAPASLANATMISDLLSGAGYACGYVGRWGIGNDFAPGHGFSHAYTLAPEALSYTNPVLLRNGERVQEKGYLADLLTSEADRFIRAQAAAKPWFLTVSYLNPHPPYTGHPQKFYEAYAKAEFDTVGWEPAAPGVSRDKELLSDIVGNLRKAAASISALDDQIRRLTTALAEAGARDNTIVLFTSDNGSLLGRRGLWSDGRATDPVNMYDEVIQVPMFWAWPGRIPPEAVAPEMVSSYDVLPTLADITGVPLPGSSKLCGRSFRPVLLREPFPPNQRWENLVFGHYRETEMARDKRFKLILRNGGKGQNELFDLTTDPGEKKNQYDNASYATVQKRLTAELSEWRKKTR
jgi:arylsulfatase A-like enzyme